MPFSEFMTDTVKIIKSNGEETSSMKALVEKNKILIDRSDIIINAGDLVQRIMSNGGEETYRVLNPHYREKIFDVPAGYELEVNKLGIQEAAKEISTITNINVYGDNAKINQNSTDNSNNTFFANSIPTAINNLRLELDKLNVSSEAISEKKEIVDALESELLSAKPRKSVVASLISALPSIENITNITSFFLSLVK